MISKSTLLRSLRVLQRFDAEASPFVGIQWDGDAVLFHRSGPSGFIESTGYSPNGSVLIASMKHLTQVVSEVTTEEIDIFPDSHGILTLQGLVGNDMNTLKVHTLRQNVTWTKRHDIGEETVEIAPDAFKGINTSVFELTKPPVLRRNKLMLVTESGVVIRSQVPIEAYPYPRESFLKAISHLPVERITLTQGGYWKAIAGGLTVVVAGHRQGDAMFDMCAVNAVPVADLPATRMLQSLKSLSDLTVIKGQIAVDPAQGLYASDEYGYVNKYTLDGVSGWEPFAIPPNTARLIYDALSQADDEKLSLQQVTPDLLRLVRGPWEVNFTFTRIESTKMK